MSSYVFLDSNGVTCYDDGLGNVFGSMHEALASFCRNAEYQQSSIRDMPLTESEREWIKIIRAAKASPGLTDLLNQVKEFYILGANNG